MTITNFSLQLDDIDSRFLFALDNLDVVRRTLQDDGSANFEKNCNALYAT